jgi:hypothetical protein
VYQICCPKVIEDHASPTAYVGAVASDLSDIEEGGILDALLKGDRRRNEMAEDINEKFKRIMMDLGTEEQRRQGRLERKCEYLQAQF